MNKQKIYLVIWNYAQKNFGGINILKKYPFLKPIKNFLVSQAKSNFTEVHGYKMYLDPSDGMRLSLNKIHEELETNFVKSVLKPGDYVLDVGANIGYYTLLFAKIVGNAGKVFGFEPEPLNFNILKKNISINNYHNVVLEKTACSNKKGKTNLFLSYEGAQTHRIFRSKRVSKNFISVDVISLDDYFKNQTIMKKISFVKIDVEGAEYDVLMGMKSIIEENKKLHILLEFYPSNIKESGSDPKALLNFLRDSGFEISYIDRIKNEVKKIDNIDSVFHLYDNEALDVKSRGTNLLCNKR